MFLECDASLPIGTACEVSLILEGGADKIDIRVAGIVRRIEPSGMAVQFIKLFGSESLIHLQNLVLYNSGDQVAQVEKDFLEHTGLKIFG